MGDVQKKLLLLTIKAFKIKNVKCEGYIDFTSTYIRK